MKVDIQSRHVELTQELEAHIQRKLQFALCRLEPHITALSIYLSDVNGPKGSADKQCRLQVCVTNMEDIVIKDTQTDLYCAIDRAMQRASRSVARKIARHQKLQRPEKIEQIDKLDQKTPSIQQTPDD